MIYLFDTPVGARAVRASSHRGAYSILKNLLPEGFFALSKTVLPDHTDLCPMLNSARGYDEACHKTTKDILGKEYLLPAEYKSEF